MLGRSTRRVELTAALLISVAWICLIWSELRPSPLSGAHVIHGMSDMHGMSAMHGMSDMAASHPGLAATMSSWVVMVVAMMGPAAIAGIRHTAVNSLRWRRNRAAAEYAAGYLVVWLLFGLLIVPLQNAIATMSIVSLIGVVLLAPVWQCTPLKQRALRACHRSLPLPPTGWTADRSACEFGLRTGLGCVASCWCLMLACVVAPEPLLWMLVGTAVVVSERRARRPIAHARTTAWALAVATLVVAVGLVS